MEKGLSLKLSSEILNQDKNCTCLLVEDRLFFAPSPPKKNETLYSVMLKEETIDFT